MNANDSKLKLGPVVIHLPDATLKYFYINADLAELFGLEYSDEVPKKFNAALKALPTGRRPKLNIDFEGDNTSIKSPKAEMILEAALLINDLSIASFKKVISSKEVDQAKKALAAWKRPKKQNWKVGDVFSIPLSDGSYGFGQILDEQYKIGISCALFELKSPTMDKPVKEICGTKVISVLHTTANLLNNFHWRVFGNFNPVTKGSSGSSGEVNAVGSSSYSPNVLGHLLEAYYGLAPWNSMKDENYYDKMLLPGKLFRPAMKRPKTAKILSPEERDALRISKGFDENWLNTKKDTN